MSADLFAEFANPTSASTQPKQAIPPQSKPATNSPADPFAFLFSPASQTASPQTFHSPAQPWPSIQQQQQKQQNGSNAWSNIGTHGATANAPHQPAQETVDDDDGWGDFEEAPSATATHPPTSIFGGHGTFPGATGDGRSQATPPIKNRIQRADTFSLISNSLVGIDEPEKIKPWQDKPSWNKSPAVSSGLAAPAQVPRQSTPQPPVPKPKPKSQQNNSNADVLFDADDFDGDEDDEFGDFETVEAPPVKLPKSAPAPVQTAMADLLSLDFASPAQSATVNPHVTPPISARKEPPSQLLSTLNLNVSPNAGPLSPNGHYPSAPRSPSFSDRNPFPGLKVTTPVFESFPKHLQDDDKNDTPTPVTAWPGADSAPATDDYNAFADFPPDASSATPAGSGKVTSSWDWGTVEPPEPRIPPRRSSKNSKPTTPTEEVIGPPPTNVPPPSILLSIFPELLEEADSKLYKPAANQAPGTKARIYADPATIDYVRGYLVLATVAARILAGRKLRWHRDKFLSQSMTISAAGSKGGMKLAGLDKTQSAREDREAADVVGVWRDHVGKLRSAVAAANVGITKQPVKLPPLTGVPEINDHMIVSTAKIGALTAPRACVVCGLKRDERVKGVDFEVEDSFGEWWVEHWGHRACRNFWLGNEGKLRSR